MAANPSVLMRLVAASVTVSNRASQIIREILKTGNLGIVEKGKNDLQTEADRSAQRCIVASLHKQFPKVSIFGEEQLDPKEKIPPSFMEVGQDAEVLKYTCPKYLQNVKEEDIVIWVDPLDGTAEFTQGLLDHVTVLIGIAVKGNAVAGIVNQPYFNYENPKLNLGRCIWGIIGLGSFGFERELPPTDKVFVTTTRSHSDRLVTEAVNACNADEVIRVGGAGHKVLLLIEGKVHAYVFASKGCKKWDTCAPEAILHAIGGYLTDMHGIKMDYSATVQRKNTGGVLATVTKENHKKFLGFIPNDVKSMMDKSQAAPEMDFMDSCQETEQTTEPLPSNNVPSDVKKQALDETAASPTPSTDSVGTTSSSLSDSVQKETVTTKL